jgi:Uma2 family endonuclease
MTFTLDKPTQEQSDDQRMLISGSWESFEFVRKGFAESRAVKLFYYDGTIEIVMPGVAHELFKSIIAVLIEAFLLSREIEFRPTGSMTQERKNVASLQADESYTIGLQRLSIEVTFTSGNASKLSRYQAIGVDEVWFWEDGVLEVYHLRQSGYERVDRSEIFGLAAIDMTVLSQCILMGETSIVQASKTFLAAHKN